VIEANTRFKYSNHAYGLAGLVIEAVTGEPCAAWIKRAIVEPAGLAETEPDIAPAPKPLLAQGHSGKLPLGRGVGCRGAGGRVASVDGRGVMAWVLVRARACLANGARARLFDGACVAGTGGAVAERTEYLEAIALAGAGVGIGNIFAAYISGSFRNPEQAPRVFANVILGFALAEATGLFGLVVALLLLFVL